MRSYLILAATLAAATSLRTPSPPLRASIVTVTRRPRPPPLRAAPDDAPWRDEEDWALLDAVPDFTVGEGDAAATFWTALASSSAALRRRSAADCERRSARLAAEQDLTLPRGGEPEVLDAWSRLPDGRLAGRVGGAGRAAWLTVGEEGRLASDPRPGPGYVETIGGRVYELGEPAVPGPLAAAAGSSAFGAAGERGEGAECSDLLASAARWMQLSSLSGMILVGALCFALGASLGPPSAAGAGAPARSAGAAERVSLTVSEQRARQALRVAADRQKLDALRAEAQYEPGKVVALKRRAVELENRPPSTDREQGLADLNAGVRRERERVARRISATELQQRRDEQGLAELTRVEKERGAGARAVQLGVFPASAVDEVTARTVPSGVPRATIMEVKVER